LNYWAEIAIYAGMQSNNTKHAIDLLPHEWRSKASHRAIFNPGGLRALVHIAVIAAALLAVNFFIGKETKPSGYVRQDGTIVIQVDD
jgi:hypothetical protein